MHRILGFHRTSIHTTFGEITTQNIHHLDELEIIFGGLFYGLFFQLKARINVTKIKSASEFTR